MLWLGYEIGLAFGWRVMDALFLGAMLSISSTTITVKALEGLGLQHQRFAEVTFGILIVEDVLAIGMIALLSGVAVTGSVDTAQIVHTLGGLTVFLVTSLVIGILAIPRLLDFVARFNSNEMLLIAVLGLCFGFCLLVLQLGYSVALGAFVIGVIIAEATCLKRIERVIAPVRDMFSAIFFVAIGLLLDPRVLLRLRRTDCGNHSRRGDRQDRLAQPRCLHRRPRRPHIDEGRHDAGPDRRILVHHRHARQHVESDECVFSTRSRLRFPPSPRCLHLI